MKTGYPFLKISQIYNISYETVLMAADYVRNIKGRQPETPRFWAEYEAFNSLSDEAASAVHIANGEMRGMSFGFFDWQAGHHVIETA